MPFRRDSAGSDGSEGKAPVNEKKRLFDSGHEKVSEWFASTALKPLLPSHNTVVN